MLVLASASPRRRELLTRMGVRFRIEAADVDETSAARFLPEDVAPALAREKAQKVAQRHARAVVLGADTVVVTAEGELLGKPRDAADATRMLRELSGTTQRVITGVCVVSGGVASVETVTTHVTMRVITADEIDAYVASGEPFGKAGAYAIQETGDRFVTRVDGSWSNVVGLPVERVTAMLRAAGIHVPEAEAPPAGALRQDSAR